MIGPACGGIVRAAGARDLYLRVVVNGSEADQLLPFVEDATGLATTVGALRQAGLKMPGDDAAPVRLAAVEGLSIAYDAASQLIRLTAPVALLDRPLAVLRPGGAAPQTATAAPTPDALLLNYDLFGEGAGRHWTAAAWAELRAFGWLPGVASQSFIARLSEQSSAPPNLVRLDSTWRLDDPERLLELEAGDTVTSGLSWMRRGRIGGLALRRRLSLQPTVPTAPFPALAGEAVLPSTVELFIDGVRQSVHQVPAGNFLVDTAPRLSGLGQAELRVTDMLGQVRTTSVDFYGAPNLLRAGLAEGSIEAGFPRLAYGTASARYASSPLLNAVGRYGLNDALTVEGMVQASRGLVAAGGGGALRLGSTGGVVTAALAASRHGSATGLQQTLGYSWYARSLSLAASTTLRSCGYLEALELAEAAPFRRRDALFIGGQVFATQLGLGYARQTGPGDTRETLSGTAAWQVQRNALLTLAVHKELGHRGATAIQLQWLVTLDGPRTASLGARSKGHAVDVTAEAAQAAHPDVDGWGWRVRAGASAAGQLAEAHLSRSLPSARWSAGLASAPGTPVAMRADASGSVLFLASGAYPMRDSPDAFAVVRTDGVPGVAVRLENRMIGRTDGAGQLLVTDLVSNQKNRLAIDPLDVPLEFRPDLTEQDVVPRSRSGALVSFRLRRIRPVHATVHDAQGRALPAGIVGQLRPAHAEPGAEPQPVVVGHEGEIYIEDLARDGLLVFELPAGPCQSPLDAGSRTAPAQRLALACLPIRTP